MSCIIFPVNDRITSTSHLDSLKVWHSEPSWSWSYIYLLGVELMESQVQSSSDAGEKDSFCVCVCASEHHGNGSQSIHVCVCLCMCMWLNKGQDSISVFGHGAGPVAKGVFLASVWPSSGKQPSDSESHIPITNSSLFQPAPPLYLFLFLYRSIFSFSALVFLWKSH